MNLKTILDETGLPVAYDHFTETDQTPIPELPFIVYREEESAHLNADNTIYHRVQDYSIELYTKIKDPELEDELELVLLANDLPFSTSATLWIEEEKMFVKYYEVRLI